MTEHLKKSEAELNLLLTEYWKLRYETGAFCVFCIRHSINDVWCRCIYGNSSKWAWDASSQYVTRVPVVDVYLGTRLMDTVLVESCAFGILDIRRQGPFPSHEPTDRSIRQ